MTLLYLFCSVLLCQDSVVAYAHRQEPARDIRKQSSRQEAVLPTLEHAGPRSIALQQICKHREAEHRVRTDIHAACRSALSSLGQVGDACSLQIWLAFLRSKESLLLCPGLLDMHQLVFESAHNMTH